MWMAQRAGQAQRVQLGHYEMFVILHSERRSSLIDGDNHLKCVNDWLQRVELIHNDRLCDHWGGAWGTAPAGCRVLLIGEPYVSVPEGGSRRTRR